MSDPKPVVTLPRPDFPAADVRAWLFDGERRWLAALDCRDITARLSLEVCVHEHRDEYGRRKKGRKYAFGSGTEEQQEREHAAGGMLEDRQAAMFATRRILVHVADLRHQSHAQETALVAHLTHAARTDGAHHKQHDVCEALKVLLSPEDYAALGIVDEGVPS